MEQADAGHIGRRAVVRGEGRCCARRPRRRTEAGAGTPFVVGGEACFCARQWTAPPLPGNFGAVDRAALQAAKLTLVSAEQPLLIADHAFTTGQVPLTTFEKVLSPSKLTVGVNGRFGCYPDKLPKDERQEGAIPDKFGHEIATVYNLKGRGLIVLNSCSHDIPVSASAT